MSHASKIDIPVATFNRMFLEQLERLKTISREGCSRTFRLVFDNFMKVHGKQMGKVVFMCHPGNWCEGVTFPGTLLHFVICSSSCDTYGKVSYILSKMPEIVNTIIANG